MNTAYPGEAVSQQDRRQDWSPGLPGGPGVVHTTVIIPLEPEKDHIIWSLLSFVYGNVCCFGLAALIFSVKARDRKVVGDQIGARHYASTARCFNIVATVLTSLALFIFARDKKMVRDLEAALRYASQAFDLDISATVVICLFILTPIIYIIKAPTA